MTLTKWMPKRLELKNEQGQKTTLDVGTDATITVIVKGPYCDLTFKDVWEFKLYPTDGMEKE